MRIVKSKNREGINSKIELGTVDGVNYVMGLLYDHVDTLSEELMDMNHDESCKAVDKIADAIMHIKLTILTSNRK